MTVRQLWVQGEDYNARDDRFMWECLLPAGPSGALGVRLWGAVRSLGDLILTMSGATTGRVSKGAVFIAWGNSVYCLVNDADAPVTFEPAHATMARIDVVVAQVRDAEVGGQDAPASIYTISGQPATNPSAPGTPDGAYRLWSVRYNAGSTAPILTDERTGTPVVPSWRSRRSQVITTDAQGRFTMGFDMPFNPASRSWISVVACDGDSNMARVRVVGVAQGDTTENGFTGYVRNLGTNVPTANHTMRIIYIATDA